MAVDHPVARPWRPDPAFSRQAEDAADLVGDERLPCGRLVSQVWDQARGILAEHDHHADDCPYCRQAVEGLTTLDAATRTLRVQNPSALTVAERVINTVRVEARLGRLLPLDDPSGDLRIAETSAAKVLRRAADRVPGVRAASCRLTPHGDHTTRVTLAMTLAATLDRPLPQRAAQVRRAVAYAVQRELGLAVSSIDLTVASVLTLSRPMTLAEATPGSGAGP